MWDNALILLREEQNQVLSGNAQFSSDSPEAAIREMLRNAILQSLKEKSEIYNLQKLGQRIMSTLNVAELMDALAEDLPGLGIRSAYLSLYDDPPDFKFPQTLPQWSRLMLAFNSRGRSELSPKGIRFPTKALLPSLPMRMRVTRIRVREDPVRVRMQPMEDLEVLEMRTVLDRAGKVLLVTTEVEERGS